MRIFDDTLQAAYFQMHELRNEIQATMAVPEPVDPETHADFESTLAQVINEVRPHVVGGDSRELRKLWQEQRVGAVANFASRTRTYTEAGEDEFGIHSETQELEIRRLDLSYLIRVSQILDRISKELGLMPQTKKAGKTGGAFS